MEIDITRHAVKRYRERLFDYKMSDNDIKRLLSEIAVKGKMVRIRPSAQDNSFEIKFRGISIVLLRDQGKSTVLTVLGESCYRKWIKRNSYKTCGKICIGKGRKIT